MRLKRPAFILFTVLAFIYVKQVTLRLFRVVQKVFFFIQRGKMHPCLCTHFSGLFSLSFCYPLSSPSAATAAPPSTSLKSHCCIFNYLRLITSPLQGDERLLEYEPTWGIYYKCSRILYASIDSHGCCPCARCFSIQFFFCFCFFVALVMK